QANQSYSFTWDGIDAYGRELAGTQPITVRVGYVYQAFYYRTAADYEQAFARFPNDTLTSNPARDEVTIWNQWQGFVGVLASQAVGLGNWTIEVHHAYDPRPRPLQYGDGTPRSAPALDLRVINTYAGGGFASLNNGDNGRADAARLSAPS